MCSDLICPCKGAVVSCKEDICNKHSIVTCRVVRLIGLDAKVKADIGPLKSEIKGLEWAGDGRLYIQLSRHIFVASADGETVRTVQEIQEDGTIVAMAISPSASHLAASIHSPSDNQVQNLHFNPWQAVLNIARGPLYAALDSNDGWKRDAMCTLPGPAWCHGDL